MKMEVSGTRAKARMRWMDNIRHDTNGCHLEQEDGQDMRRKV